MAVFNGQPDPNTGVETDVILEVFVNTNHAAGGAPNDYAEADLGIVTGIPGSSEKPGSISGQVELTNEFEMAKDLSSARLRPVVISLYDDTGNFVGQATVSAEWSGIGAVSSNLTQSSSRSHAFTSVQYFNAYARDATASASVQSGSVDLMAGETLQFANLGLIRDGNLTIIRS